MIIEQDDIRKKSTMGQPASRYGSTLDNSLAEKSKFAKKGRSPVSSIDAQNLDVKLDGLMHNNQKIAGSDASTANKSIRIDKLVSN